MAFIRVPNTVRVELIQRLDGQELENVFHCANAVSYDAAAMRSLCEAFILWWDTDIDILVSADLSLVNTIATDLDSETGPRVEESTGLPIAGIPVSPALPNNIALVAKWTTESRGRSFRGRSYFAGLREDVVTNNTIQAALLTSWEAACSSLIADIATEGWTLVVASLFEDNAPRAEGITTAITGVSIDSTVASQRRRLPGRGS